MLNGRHRVNREADTVADECDACAVSKKAPHLTAEGASLVPAFREQVQSDPLFPDSLTKLQDTRVTQRWNWRPQITRRSRRHGLRFLVNCVCSGEWESEVWAGWYYERDIRLQFQGKGARPWMLERRNGLPRGI